MIRKAQRWLGQEKSDIDYLFYKSLLNKLLDLTKNYYNDKLISLVLYGSVARGTAKKDSDIDIILITDNLSHTDSMDRFLLIEEKLKESSEFIRNDFFEKRLEKLRMKLKELQSKRIFQKDGSWYWILAPNLKFGESFEI